MTIYTLFHRCPKGTGQVFGGSDTDHCLEALIKNDKDKIFNSCKLRLYNEGPMTVQLEQHVHFLHFDEDNKVYFSCEHEDSSTYWPRGNHVSAIITTLCFSAITQTIVLCCAFSMLKNSFYIILQLLSLDYGCKFSGGSIIINPTYSHSSYIPSMKRIPMQRNIEFITQELAENLDYLISDE